MRIRGIPPRWRNQCAGPKKIKWCDLGFNVRLPCGTNSIAIVAASGFNRESKIDLAVTVGADSVSILLGNGDGTLSAKTSVPAGSTPSSTAVADFNGDGAI